MQREEGRGGERGGSSDGFRVDCLPSTNLLNLNYLKASCLAIPHKGTSRY